MKTTAWILSLLLSSAAFSQNCFYGPDNDPTTGTVNVGGFGSGNRKYQMLVHASDLGSLPALISEISFAASGTGIRRHDSLRIRMDHFLGTTLSLTFAQNLTNPITVLDVREHKWHNIADTWNRVGMQRPFLFNGRDNVLIEIESMGVTGLTSGMRRDSVRYRITASWTGSVPPPAAASSGSLAAHKIQLCSGLADTWRFGEGCPGSNLQVPNLAYLGTGRIGTVFTAQLSGAAPLVPALLLVGFNNATFASLVPLPFDLTGLGAPGCPLYVDFTAVQGTVTDPAGLGQVPTAVPNTPALINLRVYQQFMPLDQAANALGLTTSNYGRVLLGL